MNIKDILEYNWDDIRKMKRSELARITSTLSSAANKRIKRFEKADETSPAYAQAMKTGKFSVAGKNVNQLRAEFTRAKQFLESRTSTVRQWKVVQKETVNTLSSMGVNIPKEDVKEVMKLYGKLKSEFPDLVASSDIYAPTIQQIYDRIQQGEQPDAIIDDMKSLMIEGYEQRERLNNEFDLGGVSGYFYE